MAMDENPYLPPRAPVGSQAAVGVRSGKREDLRSVAQYQKGILVCILVYIVLVVAQFLVPPNLRQALLALVLVDGVAATVFVFLLSIKVYSVALGVVLGLLTLVPCLGLIILLIINNKATNILRSNGHQVGLLGANLAEF